jgi:hypothetical protein
MGPNTFSPFQYPTSERQQNNFEEVDINNFSDQIPPSDNPRLSRITTRQLHHEIDVQNDHTNVHRRSLAKSLFWPTLILITPITLLSAALLALVFAYEAQTDPDLFQPSGHSSQGSSSYILVNFSATRLVFVASFLSSTAPILTSFVMTLWTLPAVESMRLASLEHNYSQLPTPYQLSLVIGMTLASYERLWRYLAYLVSPSRSQIPRVVHRAAAMLMATTILALAVFGSDAALHFTTTTVPFNQITSIAIPDLQYGRGLSEICLNFDRLENQGLPCSYNLLGTDPNTNYEQNEIFRLQHNISQVSELLVIEEPSLEHGDMVILAQQGTTVQSTIDYTASTIGVSTQCVPITTKCDMRTDPDNIYHTLFNCTDEFWGILGAPPNVSQTLIKAVDANVPGLAYKPASNIQYAFFNDSDLESPYNPLGYNANGSQTLPPYTNAELINPIYFALAGRIDYASESAGSHINNDSEVYPGVKQQEFYDFVLSCSITSYDVNLTFSNNSVQSTTFTPTNNGSVLEIFQGVQFYVTINTGGTDLQDYLDQVALQNTTDALAKQWGSLYSEKVLSTIGGYVTPRTNLAQQTRTLLLVASVPKAALGALIACSLAYTLLGLTLGFAAYRASGTDVRNLAAQLSLAGLVTAAFGDKTAPSSAGTEKSDRLYDQKFTRQDNVQVGIARNSQDLNFRGWV